MEKRNDFAKITLKEYYSALPKVVYPKTEFIRRVAEECHVSESTVRNWIRFGWKPADSANANKLSEITGIPVERLFV